MAGRQPDSPETTEPPEPPESPKSPNSPNSPEPPKCPESPKPPEPTQLPDAPLEPSAEEPKLNGPVSKPSTSPPPPPPPASSPPADDNRSEQNTEDQTISPISPPAQPNEPEKPGKPETPEKPEELEKPEETPPTKEEGSGDSETEVPPDLDSESKEIPAKRRASENDQNEQCSSKKLRKDLQETLPSHDSILSEYISNLPCHSEDEINKHAENIMGEIETLRELARAKEVEWNHLLYLRKVKEEILVRLLRKKNILTVEKIASNISEQNKESINKQVLKINNSNVEDPNDELQKLKPKSADNGVQLNSSGLVMLPVNSNMYCQPDLSNFNFENHPGTNPFNNKTVLKPSTPKLVDFPAQDVGLQSNKYNPQMGRQGPIKDVQSIIADYRQKHPDETKVVPRRGRRLRPVPQMPIAPRMPIPPHMDPNLAEMGMLFGGVDVNAHLPTMDSVQLQQNTILSPPGVLPNGMSFKDVLVQFASLNQQTGCMVTRLPPPPPYPEVTLHPVGLTIPTGNQQYPAKISQPQPNSSLLHGILTKSQPRQDSRFSTFSPTLAKLLTAPEKNLSANNTCRAGNLTNPINSFMMQKQTSSEITITAVQPQNNNHQGSRHQQEVVQLDEFEEAELEDDSADRPLIIDESGRTDANPPSRDAGNGTLDLGENEVPECQGCRRREAQFVCAGCANQWYCSRECQVSAWDEHSEVCSG